MRCARERGYQVAEPGMQNVQFRESFGHVWRNGMSFCLRPQTAASSRVLRRVCENKNITELIKSIHIERTNHPTSHYSINFQDVLRCQAHVASNSLYGRIAQMASHLIGCLSMLKSMTSIVVEESDDDKFSGQDRGPPSLFFVRDSTRLVCHVYKWRHREGAQSSRLWNVRMV